MSIEELTEYYARSGITSRAVIFKKGGMYRNKLYARFHALLNELGIKHHKEDVLFGYGVDSTRGLSDFQLLDAINRLEEEKRSRGENPLKTQRSVVLSLLTDMGVYYVARGEVKSACWDRVNQFLEQPKVAGKKLYLLSVEELKALVRKLRSMQTKGYMYNPKEIEKPIGEEALIPFANKNIIN